MIQSTACQFSPVYQIYPGLMEQTCKQHIQRWENYFSPLRVPERTKLTRKKVRRSYNHILGVHINLETHTELILALDIPDGNSNFLLNVVLSICIERKSSMAPHVLRPHVQRHWAICSGLSCQGYLDRKLSWNIEITSLTGAKRKCIYSLRRVCMSVHREGQEYLPSRVIKVMFFSDTKKRQAYGPYNRHGVLQVTYLLM